MSLGTWPMCFLCDDRICAGQRTVQRDQRIGDDVVLTKDVHSSCAALADWDKADADQMTAERALRFVQQQQVRKRAGWAS